MCSDESFKADCLMDTFDDAQHQYNEPTSLVHCNLMAADILERIRTKNQYIHGLQVSNIRNVIQEIYSRMSEDSINMDTSIGFNEMIFSPIIWLLDRSLGLCAKFADLKFMQTQPAEQITISRYRLRKNTHNSAADTNSTEIETTEEWFSRVSFNVSIPEYIYNVQSGTNRHKSHIKIIRNSLRKATEFMERVYKALMEKKFFPAGRTLANVAGEAVPNCVVLHICDDLENIYEIQKQAALLQQQGSGIGFPWHHLRPVGFPTRVSRAVSSGPIGFLNSFNSAFRNIKQHNRHGANMAVMRVDHPDILDFLHCKDKEGDLDCFNISVGLTDEFMKQATSGDSKPWMCVFNGKQYKPRRIIRDSYGCFQQAIEVDMTAREIFKEIVQHAWKNGEPGCLFLDTANEDNPIPSIGKLEATNPCGEQFLHDGDVCNLGSVNMSVFVPLIFDPEELCSEVGLDYVLKLYLDPLELERWLCARFMKDEFLRVCRLGARILDNVIDTTGIRVDKVHKTSRKNRRIGLGILGHGDALMKLGIPYDSETARCVTRIWCRWLYTECELESELMATERGCFPNWDRSVFFMGYSDLLERRSAAAQGTLLLAKRTSVARRNCSLTSHAPTGTMSCMADTSGGIEPFFSLSYDRSFRGQNLRMTNKTLVSVLLALNLDVNSILSRVSKDNGSIKSIHELHPNVRRVFVTSQDIDPLDHVLMQAAAQEWTDNSISKTVNCPNSATVDQIEDIYTTAWVKRCKGITVYRSGSRDVEVLKSRNVTLMHYEKQISDIASDVNLREAANIFIPAFAKLIEKEGAEDLHKLDGIHHMIGKLQGVLGILHKAIVGIDTTSATLLRSSPETQSSVQIYTDSGLSNLGDERSLPSAVVAETLDIEIQKEKCPSCSASSVIRSSGCKDCEKCGWSACSI